MDDTIRVLFMQSQSYFGSDSMIQSLLMRYLNRERVTVHAACNPGTRTHRSGSIKALTEIPNLHLRPTLFGPTINSQSKTAVARATIDGTLPMLTSLGGLARYVRKHRIQILHGTEKPRDAFYGILLARLTGAKIIVHVHVKAADWMSPLTRWAMRHADGLLGVSAFVEESLHAAGYCPSRTFHVVNSLDLSQWNSSIDGSTVRQEFGVTDTTALLAIIARIFPWKGHMDLIKALALVKEHNPNFRLLVVGEDDPRATPGGQSYTAELRRLVHDLNLTEHVTFTGFRSDVAQILAAADVFTMPSYEEPCAVAYIEAMAMRKPVVALDGSIGGGGGTRELVLNGQAGLLSQAHDIRHLAENILRLINDPDLRQRMGTFGRARVEQYLNPKRMADETEEVYRRLLC